MAIVTGTEGNVTVAAGVLGGVAHFRRWSADIRRDIFEVSEFDGTSTAKTKIGGMHDLSFSVEGNLDDTANVILTQMKAADLIPAATVVLTQTTGRTLTFNAIVTSYSVSVDKTGQGTFTMSGESSGTITEA